MMVRRYENPPCRAVAVHGGPGAPGSAGGLAEGLAAVSGACVLEPFQSKRTIRALIEELHMQIAAETSGSVVLIGHSWGAWLAALFAEKHPRRIRKLVLVGSGPLTIQYVPQIEARRTARLDEEGRKRFAALPALLEQPDRPDRDALLAELGSLCDRSDAYAPSDSTPASLSAPAPDAKLYAAVWSEAAELRRSGELLRIFARLAVPVSIIHGEFDPHPPEGVREPLESVGLPFTFHLLPHCGHTPWREKFARAAFFRLLTRELA